jgi:hypothetical protein
MGGNSPVLVCVVLLREVFLVHGKEGVKLDALLKVRDCLKAADVLHEVKVAVSVNTCTDKSVPMDTLQFDVSVVLLETEVERLSEVDVGTFNGVHVFSCHFELGELEVLWEHLHFIKLLIIT